MGTVWKPLRKVPVPESGVIKIKEKGGKTQNKMAELKMLVKLANRYFIAQK